MPSWANNLLQFLSISLALSSIIISWIFWATSRESRSKTRDLFSETRRKLDDIEAVARRIESNSEQTNEEISGHMSDLLDRA